MIYYELSAELTDYLYFKSRQIGDNAPHFHRAPEIIIIESGEQTVFLDGKERVLKAGEGCFADSFCVHAYPECGATGTVILGDKKFFQPFYDLNPEKTLPAFFKFDDFDFIKPFIKVLNSYDNLENKKLAFCGIISLLVSKICETNQLVSAKKDKQAAFVCDVLKYASENLSSDLSLDALKSEFGYSKEHISRILHKHLNENWNSFINHMRLREAYKKINENPTLSVNNIVIGCGFGSTNTFYRSFQKEFGDIPIRR